MWINFYKEYYRKLSKIGEFTPDKLAINNHELDKLCLNCHIKDVPDLMESKFMGIRIILDENMPNNKVAVFKNNELMAVWDIEPNAPDPTEPKTHQDQKSPKS